MVLNHALLQALPGHMDISTVFFCKIPTKTKPPEFLKEETITAVPIDD